MSAARLAFVVATIGLVLTSPGGAQPDPFQDVIRNLRHPKPETRLDALDRLNRAAHAAAAEAVAPLVTDADDRVQLAAIDATLSFFLIDRVNPSRVVMGLGSSKSRAQEAFDSGPLLRGSGPAPVLLIDRLIAAMRDETPRVAFDAVHALGFIAERPLSPAQASALAAELDHYDPIMRAATARVLARLRVREGADKLVLATVDSNVLVRRFAVDALGWTGEARVVPQLRQLAAQARHPLRPEAFLALARLGSREDALQFRQLVTEREVLLRRAGVEGLGRLGDRESIDVVRRMLAADRSAEVRLAAAFALHKLGEPQSHIIASRLGVNDEATQACEYLLELGRDAVPGVAAALGVTTEVRHRAALIQVIGYLGDATDIGLVEPALKDRDARVVRAATHAITRLRRR